MINKQREAIVFLVKYVGVYLTLNLLYAWFIEYHAPQADPITIEVTRQVTKLLSLSDASVSFHVPDGTPNVPILQNNRKVVAVFEGCNSINVMIVFAAFLVAFKGPQKLFWKFLLAGLAVVYVMNLLRVMALYGVALHFPDRLYFFHKFFFTGVIYLVVFVLWFLWTKKIKSWKSGKDSPAE